MPWGTFWLTVLIGLASAAAFTVLRHGQEPPRSYLYAAAIERGEQQAVSPPLDPDAAEDEAITHDAQEAGYRWAERRSVADPTRCEELPGDFRRGCEDWVSEQNPGPAKGWPRPRS